jgi:hypothetical protein
MRKKKDAGSVSESGMPGTVPPERRTMPLTEEDLRYDFNEFLCPGSDDKGMSVRLFFRCPPQMERALEVLRDSKIWPYKTVSDIVRHAVVRHIERLHAMEPTVPRHFLSGLKAVVEVVKDAEINTMAQSTFGKMDSLIDRYVLTGDMEEAIRLMTLAKSQMNKMPNNRWKREWLKNFTKKYSRHLGAPTVDEAEPTQNQEQTTD